jgi:protein-disulfide isomerase
VRQLWADRNSSAVKDLGAKFDAQGQADKVPGTPTLYVGKTGTKGHVVNIASADDYKTLANAIDQIAP